MKLTIKIKYVKKSAMYYLKAGLALFISLIFSLTTYFFNSQPKKKETSEESSASLSLQELPQETKAKIYDFLKSKDLNALHETSNKTKKSVLDYVYSQENTIEINQEGSFYLHSFHLHSDKPKKELKENPCPFFNLNTEEKIACIENFFQEKSLKIKELQIDFPVSQTTQELRLQIDEKQKIENYFKDKTKITGFFFCKESQELHHRILEGNIEDIDLLLTAKPDQTKIFYYTENNWTTPLALTVIKKDIPTFQKILPISNLAKANRIHYYNSNIPLSTHNPLLFTFSKNNDEFNKPIAEMLLKEDPKGYLSKDIDNGNIIHYAAEAQNSLALDFFLELFPDGAKHKTNNTKETPLHIAAKKGNETNIESLLLIDPKGINQKNFVDITPMHEAVINGHLETVKNFLFINKNSINKKNNKGWLPIHLAAKYGHTEIAKILIEIFPEGTQIKNNDGSLPIDFAACHGLSSLRFRKHFFVIFLSLRKHPILR
jgi:ankyrin repeat protein